LEKALAEAHRESLRQQALVRAAQRSLGIKPPSSEDSKSPAKDARGHRKRGPTVRALRAARRLAQETPTTETELVQQADQDPIGRPAASSADGSGELSGASTTQQGAAG
jgi:hypothetical protein